jgi:hypothetical protein
MEKRGRERERGDEVHEICHELLGSALGKGWRGTERSDLHTILIQKDANSFGREDSIAFELAWGVSREACSSVPMLHRGGLVRGVGEEGGVHSDKER